MSRANGKFTKMQKIVNDKRSNAKSSTGSGEDDQAASSDEATSSESIPAPPNNDPTPVAGELNRWYVEGQWQIYQDAKIVNDKQKMARLITEERKVLTRSLHTDPDIHRLFNLHKCDWMARDPGTYSEEIVREFYASYAATLRGSISKRSKTLTQDPLTSTLVRECPVETSPTTIRRFLYGPTAGHSWALNTSEFDYRWDTVRSGAFQRNFEQRETVIFLLARYIAADGERAEWVVAPRLGIRKATLNFVAKFFWLLVREMSVLTKGLIIKSGTEAIMVSGLVARGGDRLCPHVASRDTREGIRDVHYLPLFMSNFSVVRGTAVSIRHRVTG
ncbi:hypothetical protein H5410_002008 [Solanum commersonii]|uniref:Putative plant transposon protein domain-containing protein n=1 Tax=Solanum commersonii TaxID=4109 RepID=A0A9J6B162_SOLCO|nr:hypothetical protein H5410_002008 [Solanum commersonii]